MTKRPNPPTLDDLKVRGDKLMAEARQAVMESRQIVVESRIIREAIAADDPPR